MTTIGGFTATLDSSKYFRQSSSMHSHGDWQRLASYVVAARVALGYRDRRSFAAHLGITDRTIGNLETGRPVGPNTLAAVENAVAWKPGSARAVLEGREPVPRDAGADVPDGGPSFADPADPAEQHLLRTPGVSDDTAAALIVTLRVMRQRDNAEHYRAAYERERRELRRHA